MPPMRPQDLEQQMLPSTLGYRDRSTMKSVDSNAYAKLYNNSTLAQPVWGRLHHDASVRTSRALRPTPPEPLFAQQPDSPFGARDTLSGFVSNTKRVVYNPDLTFKTGRLQFDAQEVPVEELRPLQLSRFKQHYPMDYFIAIRPDSESTNQTLRMLGTYATDASHTTRSQTFVPSGCPGGPPSGSWYHPDVRLTASAEFASRGMRVTRPQTL